MTGLAASRVPVLALNVVGLTPRLLNHMPHLRAVGSAGFTATLEPVFPAVTCSAQSSMITGLLPRDHGVVGNGWYFRDLGEVLFWRQHNGLVTGEKVWHEGRRQVPGYRVANVCWWYAMGADVDITVTPRPIYHADGRKSPDCYTVPAELHDELSAELGPFPLFSYWGPGAALRSSQWIITAACRILDRSQPDLTLVYVPHLDYDLQRYGPNSPQAVAAAKDVDSALAPLLLQAQTAGVTVIAVSEYGITQVHRAVDVNRALRREGLLRVYRQAGMEYLDPWTSKAFAVADHQIAHVYVHDPEDLPRVRALLSELPGVDEILDRTGQAKLGVDHERSGELLLIAEPDAWFTYYYWLDDDRAPDFARSVEINRKPGYDPAELFLDPADRWVKARAALTLARKAVGLRYTMRVIPLDPSPVRGSHGRLPDDPRDGPVLVCSDPAAACERLHATGVKELLLRLGGIPRADESGGRTNPGHFGVP
ncbi:nucleotide pyrophosphatase/phosphodiesterase family protein [Frankia sp. Cppng1_Ct_nod]|uniref:alkaline phosphatase family protein n=1 Tax=Frankia sp. Cppng1_Ct_nod TaxID=2897162 RepID=UPI001041845C|nr:nucleotide pyrophosphatase/phosphodiesterase family protein [Frankia sp. Cppng1_Ct_nod]